MRLEARHSELHAGMLTFLHRERHLLTRHVASLFAMVGLSTFGTLTGGFHGR